MKVPLLAHNEMLRYSLERETQLYTANELERYETVLASLICNQVGEKRPVNTVQPRDEVQRLTEVWRRGNHKR